MNEDISGTLAEKDAILRPDIETIINEYINSGGNTPDLIEFLSKGYSGLIHKIIILGKTLEGFGVPFQLTFENCMREWIVQNFNPFSFEKYMTDSTSFPEWANEMCENSFWTSVVIELMKKYPLSNFVSQLFFLICSKNPALIQKLPSCITTFDCFNMPFQYYMNSFTGIIDPSSSDFQHFFSIITTDDVTLGYFALALNLNTDISLIRTILNNLTFPQDTFFLNLLLAKHNIPYKLRSFLFPPSSQTQSMQSPSLVTSSPSFFSDTFRNSQDSPKITNRSVSLSMGQSSDRKLIWSDFTHDLIELIPPACQDCPFMIELCVKRLSRLLFDPHYHKEEALEIADVLSLITQSADVKSAIQFVRKTEFSYATFPVIFEAIQVPFFTNAFLPFLIERIKSPHFYEDNSRSDSPESVFLGEIAYFYPSLRSEIAKGVIDALKCERSSSDNQFHLNRLWCDLFNILVYLMKIGYDCLSVFSEGKINIEIRKQYLAKILVEVAKPPFNKNWLHNVRLLLENNPDQIVYPKQGQKAVGNSISILRSVASFIISLNSKPETQTYPEDVGPYDLLRRRAQNIIDHSVKH